MIDISKLSERYHIRPMEATDAEEILALCRENTLYYQYCGMEPTLEQVLSDLRVAPPGIGPEDKHYVGFYEGGSLAAVMDLIDGYPAPEVAFIGFFMVRADLQGRGVGTGIVGDVCAYLRQAGKNAVRLAIAEDNPQANHFWKKNGFRVVKSVPMDGWTALVAEKALREREEDFT